MKFKAIIIEDEHPARITLKSYLRKYAEHVEVVAECESVKESINYIKDNAVDIIFLDIQLKDGKGIEVLNKIESRNYKIIFTTAHSEYTFQAFSHLAFGYLMKPLNPLKFKEIINRVVNELTSGLNNSGSKLLRVPVALGYKWIHLKKIVRCEAESNYTKLIIENNKVNYTITKTLKYVENELIISPNFYRVHQSHLINLNFLKEFKIINNKIQMMNGDFIPVSRSKRNQF